MGTLAYLLILLAAWPVVRATETGVTPIGEDSVSEVLALARPEFRSEKCEIECANNNYLNTNRSTSRAITRDSVSDDSRSRFRKLEKKEKAEVKEETKRKPGISKTVKLNTNTANFKAKIAKLKKKIAKSKKSQKKLGKAPNESKNKPPGSSIKKTFGEPKFNPEMWQPTTEAVFLALPQRSGGLIDLSNPSKAQFEVEHPNGFFTSFFNDKFDTLEESINDNLGIHVPTTLFKGNFKVPFLDGLSKKLSNKDEDERSLKRENSAVKVRGKEIGVDLVEDSRKSSLQLTSEIVQLLTENNLQTKDPLTLSSLLMRIKSDLSKHKLEQT